MKMWLRIACMMIVGVMLLGCVPAWAEQISGAGWYFEDGVLTITSNTSNYHLASSRSDWFIGHPFERAGIQSQVTKVVVAEGVTEIGHLSCYGFSNMTEISFPSTLKSIGSYTFGSCSNLTEVTIPASVTFIGHGAFANSGINKITFEGKPPTLGSYDYYYDFNNSSNFMVNRSSVDVYYKPYNAWDSYSINRYTYSSFTWHKQYVTTGTCGANATWYLLSDGTLVISGSGDLYSYTRNGAAWYSYWSRIKNFDIASGITYNYSDSNAPRIDVGIDSIDLKVGDLMTLSNYFTAEASFLLKDDLKMTVADESVAVILDGILMPVALGSTELIVEAIGYPDLRVSVPVNVYNDVTEISLASRMYAAVGTSIELTADVTPAEGYGELVWSVDDSSAAAIDGSWLNVTTQEAATLTLTATAWNGVSQSTQLKIYVPTVSKVTLEKPAAYWGVGDTMQLKANVRDNIRSYVNQLVKFISSDETVAAVDEQGNVQFLAEGSVTLTAQAENGVADSVTLTVMPHTESLALSELPVMFVGEEAQCAITAVVPAVAGELIVWSSSDDTVATVDENGCVAAVGAGDAAIIATTWDGFTCEVPVEVHSEITAVSIDEPDEPYFILDTIQLTARVQCEAELINRFVTWESSDPSVVSVNDAGEAELLSYGTATITATTINGLTAELVIKVYEEIFAFSIDVGGVMEEGEMRAAVIVDMDPDGAEAGIVWSSSDPSIVTVDDSGVMTAIAPGTATISATAWNNLKRSAVVTVVASEPYAVELGAAEVTLSVAETFQLEAKVVSRSGYVYENMEIAFASSDDSVVVVDAQGVMTAIAPGSAVITATAGEGVTGSVNVLVECAEHHVVDDAQVDATCTESGLTAGSHCDSCGMVIAAQEVIPASGHVESALSGVEPTCTATGLTAGVVCLTCGETLVQQEVIPMAAHIDSPLEAVSPTCTETGLTEGAVCSSCGVVTAAQEIIPALGHTEVIEEAVNPTCENTGLTEGRHCSICNEVLIVQTEIPANGHTEVMDAYVAPTCENTGMTETIGVDGIHAC